MPSWPGLPHPRQLMLALVLARRLAHLCPATSCFCSVDAWLSRLCVAKLMASFRAKATRPPPFEPRWVKSDTSPMNRPGLLDFPGSHLRFSCPDSSRLSRRPGRSGRGFGRFRIPDAGTGNRLEGFRPIRDGRFGRSSCPRKLERQHPCFRAFPEYDQHQWQR
jgi:hypothetical protein